MAETKTETKPETKHELFKHSAAIQIENNITLLQRKTWNALLWNAYDELPVNEVHSIPVEELSRLVGFDSHNQDYLKVATKAMLHCIVEWDILDKDGLPDWGATALLAQVRIKGGICTYAYSPELRQRLHNPRMYARLDLVLQRLFDSKYALALWELCTDYLGARREQGKTPYISLDAFRKLMGLEEGEYRDFRDLSKRVITFALAEINRVSDFRVTVDYQRKGRKVTALKFKIRRVAMLPEPAANQGKLFPELEDMPLLVKELKDAGLSSQDALGIWQQGFKFVDEAARPADPGEDAETAFVQYVREKIHLLRRRQASGKVDNSTGFLLEAIRRNYANPEFEHEQERQAAAEAQKARKEREKQVKALEAQKTEIAQGRDKELDQLCGHVVAETPGVLDRATSELLAENMGFQHFYDRSKSALENYQGRKAVQALLNPYLERHAPARFETVKQGYAARIAAVEEQIAALG